MSNKDKVMHWLILYFSQKPLFFGRYLTVSISPSFDITCPRPEATIPIGQIQRSMLKRDLTSLKECEPGLIIDGNGKMRPKFLEKIDESELQGEEGRQYSKEGKSKKSTSGIEERDAFREAEAESEPPAELEDAIDQQGLLKIRVRHLKAGAVGAIIFGRKERTKAVVFMTSEIC
jgi:hypothetical protein